MWMGEGLSKTITKINPTILKYVPHKLRATYLDTHDLRTSTPTPYVAQRLAARACLEVPFITFGGSIHYVWRLHSLHLEAPFITFGDSKRDCHSRCAPVWCSSSGRTSGTTLVIASTKIDLWVSHLFTTRHGVFQVYKGSDSSSKKHRCY
jgi:hypothetical protein